jgi:hypothetical protein
MRDDDDRLAPHRGRQRQGPVEDQVGDEVEQRPVLGTAGLALARVDDHRGRTLLR